MFDEVTSKQRPQGSQRTAMPWSGTLFRRLSLQCLRNKLEGQFGQSKMREMSNGKRSGWKGVKPYKYTEDVGNYLGFLLGSS